MLQFPEKHPIAPSEATTFPSEQTLADVSIPLARKIHSQGLDSPTGCLDGSPKLPPPTTNQLLLSTGYFI